MKHTHKSNNFVIIETPFAGRNIRKNLKYARLCMRDSLFRGEYPLASHLLYTQKGILNDKKPEERKMGIESGLQWGRFAQKTIVYTDLGISKGMKQGIKRAKKEGRLIEYRVLPINLKKV